MINNQNSFSLNVIFKIIKNTFNFNHNYFLLTSSIYPLLVSLAAPIIHTPGSGYTSTPTVTIDPPTTSSGKTATGTAIIANGVVATIDTLMGGSGYLTDEEITFSSGTGSGLEG